MSPRRQLLALFVFAPAAVCLAQQAGRTYWLGQFGSTPSADWVRLDPYLFAFAERLSELGFDDGRSLVIVVRVSEGDPERLPGLSDHNGKNEADMPFEWIAICGAVS